MRNRDDKKQIFNLLLAKSLGVYQMLDPNTEKYLGRHNVYRCVFIMLVFYNCLISMTAFLNGLYYWSNHTMESIFYFGMGLNILYISYKMCLLLNNSKEIWDCLSITQYDFMTYGHRDRRILDFWRKRSIGITYIITIILFLFTCFYVMYPLIFSGRFVVMKNHDGSSSNYRLNVLNLCSFIPEQTYNTHYNVFYIIETVSCVFSIFCSLAFDLNLMTLCLAITCQLEMIFSAFKSVTHNESPNGRY